MALNFTVVFAIILGAVGSKHFANTVVGAKFRRTDTGNGRPHESHDSRTDITI